MSLGFFMLFPWVLAIGPLHRRLFFSMTRIVFFYKWLFIVVGCEEMEKRKRTSSWIPGGGRARVRTVASDATQPES